MAEPVGTTVTPEEQEVPASLEERLAAVEGVVMELIDKLEAVTKAQLELKKTAVQKPKGLFGGKRTPTPTKDLKTGIVYASKAEVGKAFAAEAGADPLNTMAYYTVMTKLKMPDGTDRFVDANAEEAAKALADKVARVEKEVEEANRKLAAEEAAKIAAEKAAAAPKVQPLKGKK